MKDLRKENPHASEADLKEAVKAAGQALIAKARGQRLRADTQRVAAESGMPRDVARLPETRRMTRQDVPGPPSGRMLREAESEVEQMHNYISRIGCNLHEAIRDRDADLIRSYLRALHSGVAHAHETTNREAGARGWDPTAVDCMIREVEESTATLLPEAEQVLLELEEEARANYEELDWAIRTFRRVYGEVDTASMPAKMHRVACARLDRVNNEYQRATRVVERLLQAHGGREEERRPPAGGGHREEQKYRDDFGAGRAPDPRMDYEDSIPMERQPILPVTEILAAEGKSDLGRVLQCQEGGATPA